MTKIHFASGLNKISRMSLATQAVSQSVSKVTALARPATGGGASPLAKTVRAGALVGLAALAVNRTPAFSQTLDRYDAGYGLMAGGIAGSIVGTIVLFASRDEGTRIVKPLSTAAYVAGAAVTASFYKTGRLSHTNADNNRREEQAQRLEDGLGVLEYTKSDTPHGVNTPYSGGPSQEQMLPSQLLGPYGLTIAEQDHDKDGTVVANAAISMHSDARDAVRAMRDDESVGAVIKYRDQFLHVETDQLYSRTIDFDGISKKANFKQDWFGGAVIALESNDGKVFEGHKRDLILVEKFEGE
jgi:hypothetical protein